MSATSGNWRKSREPSAASRGCGMSSACNRQMTQTATDPEHIAISKSKGIEIDWADRHHSSYSVSYLRDECPCAMCTGAHGSPPQKTSHSSPQDNPFQMYK